MEEIRLKQCVAILTPLKKEILGVISDFSYDRVLIKIENNYLETASKLAELDEVIVVVLTHLGRRTMKTIVISPLNSKNQILLENRPSDKVEQKRAYVRVKTDIPFIIEFNQKYFKCKMEDMSCVAIAFYSDQEFKKDDVIKISFSKEFFEKDIKCMAKIYKFYNNIYVAKFCDLNIYDEDRLVKYIFRKMTKK